MFCQYVQCFDQIDLKKGTEQKTICRPNHVLSVRFCICQLFFFNKAKIYVHLWKHLSIVVYIHLEIVNHTYHIFTKSYYDREMVSK